MTINKNLRKFTCKGEELPVIGGYLLTSLRHDSAVFEAYSPKYSKAGIDAFEGTVNEADRLINPKMEMNNRKITTGALYADMDAIADKTKHLEGYIIMSRGAIPVSTKDFGITLLKKQIKARDAEGVIKSLKFVTSNIMKYNKELTEQGLTTETMQAFITATTSISTLNRQQYEITNEHKMVVNDNITVLNTLYDKIIEICTIGKILFANNPEKLKEYTFSKLKKRIRIIPDDSKSSNKKA